MTSSELCVRVRVRACVPAAHVMHLLTFSVLRLKRIDPLSLSFGSRCFGLSGADVRMNLNLSIRS